MTRANDGRFTKGSRRPTNAGRRRGTPNRATRAWKEFVTGLVNDPRHQQALAEAIKARPELLFKAAEHAVGKPRQEVDVDQALAGGITIRWQDDITTRLHEGRKRLAAAKLAESGGDTR